MEIEPVVNQTPLDRNTAIHEAGHVVALIRFDLGCGYASIMPIDETAGFVTIHLHAENKREAEARAVSCCAGYAARIVAGDTEELAAFGCDNDFDSANKLIEDWGLDNLVTFKVKAVDMLRLPENVKAVDLIALHLLKRGRLDSEYMQVLVEVVDGESTEADFLGYLAGQGLKPL